MARECIICKKRAIKGRQYKKTMSQWNPTPWKRKKPNLQISTVIAEAKDRKNRKYSLYIGKKVLMCTKCIKTMYKPKD